MSQAAGSRRRARLLFRVPDSRGVKACSRSSRAFLLRGNVVDLAVAVVVGAAFGAVVTSLVTDILTPILGIPGKADFSNLTFTINESVFRYGRFLTP